MSQSFITELSKRTGRDRKSVEALLQGLSRAILRHCGDRDTVAVPSFGSFRAEKHDEQIVTDRSTGGKLLLPPEIQALFSPAGKLRKLVESRNEDAANG